MRRSGGLLTKPRGVHLSGESELRREVLFGDVALPTPLISIKGRNKGKNELYQAAPTPT